METRFRDIHKDLIEACKCQDRKAQAQLYKHYARTMFAIAMRITNDKGEAEDILQDAFLEAFTKINTFKADSTFGAWLKRITVNKAINQLKKRKVQLHTIDYYDKEEETENEYFETIDWQVEKIQKAIQQLPDGYRVVLSLYLLEGYDHTEIAGILGISESTSKSQYSRARQKLLQIIN